jgi:hypothetical protein
MYPRKSRPFGKRWEEWAAIWCSWLLSIPKNINPSLDQTGANCAINQNDRYVWFLGGTFGNVTQVTRTCSIPKGKAIFFPILEKEDSFAEDTDFTSESELSTRAREFVDRVKYLELNVDGVFLKEMNKYRVQSVFFDLEFPANAVYNVKPGLTRAVCDGYWVFLRPLPPGKHTIHFAGEVEMVSNDIVTQQFLDEPLYKPIKELINKKSSFRLDILYNILIH